MQTIFPLSAIQRKSLSGKEKPPVPFRETGGFSAGRTAAWLALIFSTGLLFFVCYAQDPFLFGRMLWNRSRIRGLPEKIRLKFSQLYSLSVFTHSG